MDLKVDGLRVLVTAASQGLGLSCARTLTDEGASVIVSSRSESKLAEAQQDNGLFGYIAADLSSAEAIESLVAESVERLGGLDAVVVNCGPPPAVTFAQSTEEHWADAHEQVTMSAIRLTRAALPELRKSGRGRLVYITGYGSREPRSQLIVSESTRSAVMIVAKVLASEEGPNGITVNTIAPGGFLTDRVRDVGGRMADGAGISFDEQLERMVSQVPVGRLGDPDELGAMCAFLCSPSAGYINGQVIVMDGGENRAV